MSPGPPLKGLSINADLYTFSESGYWYKPKLVGPGFKFGFFSGARYYDYEIAKIGPDGLTVLYSESAAYKDLPLHIAWK